MIQGKIIQQVFLGGNSLFITGIDPKEKQILYKHTKEPRQEVQESFEIDKEGTLRTNAVFFPSQFAQRFIDLNKIK